MTYTPLQIEIIKKFGRKELTEGCIFSHSSGRYMTYICDWWRTDVIYFLDRNRVETYEYPSIYFEILWHLPHLEDILEVLYENDIWVTLWNMHKKSIILDFLNETDDLCKTREIDYDWIKEPLEQDEKVLKELLEVVANQK